MKLPRLFFAALLLGSAAALPADSAPVPGVDKIKARLADYQERLQLSPQQQTQLKPLLEETLAWLRDWRQRLEAADSRRDRRALLREAQDHQQATEKKIEPLLTDAQQKTWKAIREERREEIKEAYRNRSAR